SLDPWWLRLERGVFVHDELHLDLPSLPTWISTATLAEKVAAYVLLTNYVHRDIAVNRAVGELLLPKRQVSDESLIEDEFVSWQELRTLALDPLVTIGAHTVTHAVLSSLGESEVLDEMVRGRDRLAA